MSNQLELPGCGIGTFLSTDDPDHTDLDPRGIIKIFEMPQNHATYVLGVDPTGGISGWDRLLRTTDDLRTDNAAIEVLKLGKPDVQVAEYAAPLDPEDLASVVNFLGRMYCGNDEDGQALCIIEVQPGPGLLTQRKLISRFNYQNLYILKQMDKMTAKPTQSIGWVATPRSVRDLWIKGSRQIKRREIVLFSPWLKQELRDCAMSPTKPWGEAVGSKHDDRVRAIMLAIWAGHDFEMSEPQDTVVAVPSTRNWQGTDVTVEEMNDQWEDLLSTLD